MKKKKLRETLLLNRIDEIRNLKIPDYYKIIIIKELIRNWREEDN